MLLIFFAMPLFAACHAMPERVAIAAMPLLMF